MARLGVQLHGGVVDDTEIARVREVLLFEEPERQRKLTRFFALLILAAAIATFGLLADSVATVIGAMIVAPLMLPIMGVAFGAGLGDRKIILNSLTMSILGILTAIAVGCLLTWTIRSLVNVEANTQIMVRTAPRLIDLCAALATGLAGAFAIGRRDVSDTLPGVAIAISLVPPLANVGILLATGNPDLAAGSLLLFVTNYLAILLTGAFMFTLMGFPGAYRAQRSQSSRRTAVAIAAVLLVLILIPLTATSYATIQGSLTEQRVTVATKAWLADSDYRLVSVNAGMDSVLVIIAGEGDLPPEQDLQDALQGKAGKLPVVMEVVPQTRIRLETTQVGNP
ncbi:MAG: TIGR00341 family protein [Anaerolineae bacterium]|nr:TIGR00341 family protein [Anaerolineae bacterium]